MSLMHKRIEPLGTKTAEPAEERALQRWHCMVALPRDFGLCLCAEGLDVGHGGLVLLVSHGWWLFPQLQSELLLLPDTLKASETRTKTHAVWIPQIWRPFPGTQTIPNVTPWRTPLFEPA